MKTKNRTYALLAGISLIIMALSAAFSYGFVFSKLVIEGDPETTFLNIKTSLPLFSSGIAGWMIILITDVLVAWGLYRYFLKVNEALSGITALLRMVYAAFLGVAIYHLLAVLPSVSGNVNVHQVSQHLDAFIRTWSSGLIIFGIHLFGVGVLAFISGFIPRIWGILLLFAGLCYATIHASKLLFPEFVPQIEQVEAILSTPMAIAEIGFGVWLVVRGGKSLKKKVKGVSFETA